MPNLPFTLRQLDIFASLAATGSFRRSAELLGISQASVSSQIKALEDQLGLPLFDRAPGRRPTLRPAGLAFLDDLREFHHAAKKLTMHRRSTVEQAETASTYKVLVGQGMFDAYVRRKLDAFFSDHPLIDLEFETQLPFGQLVRVVESGQFDFALVNQRSDRPVPPDFREVAMVRGGIYGHRKFADGHKLPLTPAALSQLPFILPKVSSKQEREVMRNFESAGIRPRHVVGHTQYFDVMAAMLDRGLGIASFSAAVLPPAFREDVVMLYPMLDWQLLYYRKSGPPDVCADTVEQFLVSSVLDDPDYPAITRSWP